MDYPEIRSSGVASLKRQLFFVVTIMERKLMARRPVAVDMGEAFIWGQHFYPESHREAGRSEVDGRLFRPGVDAVQVENLPAVVFFIHGVSLKPKNFEMVFSK